jgi:hypothetical protein
VLARRFPSRVAGLSARRRPHRHVRPPLDHALHATRPSRGRRDGRRRELWAGIAPDRDWLAIDFAPEHDSAGRTYTLELRARGTGPGTRSSVRRQRRPADGDAARAPHFAACADCRRAC